MNREQKIGMTYVITLEQVPLSVGLAQRALESCLKNHMPAQIWPAFDGTGSGHIKIPPQCVTQHYVSFLPVFNRRMTATEIACWFSHYSLWCQCLCVGHSITILEHDAVMTAPHVAHTFPNTIEYLGHEWQREKADVPCDVCIEQMDYAFIRGAYAYSIDTAMARNLIAAAVREGITRPVDVFMRSDHFAITQTGVKAFHKNEQSTRIGAEIFREPSHDAYS